MEKFDNVPPLEKENKLAMIPEDFNNLSAEEAFRQKHVVFEINECFEQTKINLFDNFISLYTRSYGVGLEEQEKIKQKMEDNIYAIRFDPAFFLLRSMDVNSLASYIPEWKTLLFPDMKTYKNPEIYAHEVTHSIGSICVNAEGAKIEDHKIYNALNEGITEKMAVEMVGHKKEKYSPNVKCAQFIDMITGGKVNESFQKNDIDFLKKIYNEQINDGAFEDLVINIKGIENIFSEINESNSAIFDFEEKNDVNSVEFIKKYDAIKQIIDEEENLRLNSLKEKTKESKEKYLAQTDKADEELKKFEDEIIRYVFAKKYISKYDNGKNIDLICEKMASSFDKHLGVLIDKSNTREEQIKTMQKICNIQAAFDFSENKIFVLENIIKKNAVRLYEKITGEKMDESINVYEKLGIQHELVWINNATEK